MDTKDLAKRLSLLSEQLDHMRQEMDELIDIWRQVLVKNQDLQMENHYLRERVNQLNNEEGEEKGEGSSSQLRSPALQNLLNIYEDGYHICNISYGQRRENAEQCMFCLDILYGMEEKRS